MFLFFEWIILKNENENEGFNPVREFYVIYSEIDFIVWTIDSESEYVHDK